MEFNIADQEKQKTLIDNKPENISLIDSNVLTDEMIYYALSKRGSVLRCVPQERRTKEVCEYAISSYGRALRNVPNHIKTFEICLKAVAQDSNAIEFVPIEFLTEEFVSSLNNAGIVIPKKHSGYVDECLQIHKKLQNEIFNSEQTNSNELKLKLDDTCYNVELESLVVLIDEHVIKELKKININTVGDLLNISQNIEFYNMLLNSLPLRTHICTAVKLLKCKYMNIDPMIGFPDESTWRDDLCFSMRIISVLSKTGCHSLKQFYELIHNPDKEKILYRAVQGKGKREQSIVQEILAKGQIVVDFYDNKKEKEENATEDETIQLLEKELEQVRSEIQNLNARTDDILAKIQEKMAEKGKGGVSK